MMKILSIVAEVMPFSSVGGMARGTKYLADELVGLKNEVTIFTPLHKDSVDYCSRNNHRLTTIFSSSLPNNFRSFQEYGDKHFSILKINKKDLISNFTFFDYPEFFRQRANVYNYHDDGLRFWTFSVGCLEWLLAQKKSKQWLPELIHCHDWHTCFLIEQIKKNSRYKELANIPVLLTIHNFRYQDSSGTAFLRQLTPLDLPLEKLNRAEIEKQNALSIGIKYADCINTVSKTHALEVQEPEFGYNLAKELKNKNVVGILNGLNYEDFDPKKDSKIFFNYDEKNLIEGKKKNKHYLQKLFGLPQKGAMLFCFVGRVSAQKGIDSLTASLKRLLNKHRNVQFISLGIGDDYFCEMLWKLEKAYPKQVKVLLKHDVDLPRQIFAGSDLCLIPSNWEPGGIVAVESQRYGCIPLVRRVGGLKDIVSQFSDSNSTGNGFVYQKQTISSLQSKIKQAITMFNSSPIKWLSITSNAFNYKREWSEVAHDYNQLFLKMTR